MKILLDTDIGGDLDDALALAYLLKQPRCELLGVTTVGGEPEKRASLASAVCHAGGRAEVPVCVGASCPLLVPERQLHAYQSEALSDQWPHQTFARRNTAVEFLRETIHAHPGEITLLAIGPLTNVALLFALDPDAASSLKGLMLMGGSFLAKEADEEWNIVCDPHAAAKVFTAPLELTSVGFDVTGQCLLEAADFRRRLARANGPFSFVAEMAEVFFRSESTQVIFHDPLAAALLFEPALCQARVQPIRVELMDPRRFGRTHPSENATTKPHHVAYSVEADQFFEHFFAVAES